MGHFIDDGMQVSASIPGRTNLYDALTFEYRPPTSREFAQLQTKLRKAGTIEEMDDRQAEFLAEHVVSWSAEAEATKANLQRLHASLFARVYETVTDATQENNNVIREGN